MHATQQALKSRFISKVFISTDSDKVKVNNVFDTLYSTYGYGYEWDGYQAYYWPGATRNIFLTISYKI